ncbi:hypothetical protein [Ruminiclostridium cellobioparum]|uniref:hypothetical protein n=1 Tax=Ruminiclostridium cellobioparum TaxID=29355 RepID=UPI000AD753AE|nr:hypothetical protein [Ruminiclostridium cellobioparum]
MPQVNEVTPEQEFVKENSLNRPNDPIVIKGQDISALNGINPDELVAFKYDGGWKQIPVQVDERAVVSVAKMYNASEKIMILFELAGETMYQYSLIRTETRLLRETRTKPSTVMMK